MRQGVRGVVAVAVALAALVVPGVAVAAPANDHFADREVLSDPLPIEVAGSNDGATKEDGEWLELFAAAGHSVWFEWESTVSGWVTVGACDADFAGLLGIYTGTALDSLAKVSTEYGPECPYPQNRHTFKAVTGTKYLFVVDGDNFHFPENPLPDTEGMFTLRIEETPVPANDNFANATSIDTPFLDSFEGEDLYIGMAQGYNWNATREAGEAAHGGGPNDASVWFNWTPPVSGTVRISSCCQPGFGMAMYRGSGFGSLETMFAGALAGVPATQQVVTAGTTYRLAVYGLLEGGAPTTGTFPIHIDLRRPTLPMPPMAEPERAGSWIPPAVVQPPRTRIFKRQVTPGQRKATFRFKSSRAGSGFRCKLDRKPFRACRSPRTYSNLSAGRHVFRVVAIDAAGNVDPSAAVARFRIKGSAVG
jgi:hypothetical protein